MELQEKDPPKQAKTFEEIVDDFPTVAEIDEVGESVNEGEGLFITISYSIKGHGFGSLDLVQNKETYKWHLKGCHESRNNLQIILALVANSIIIED